MDHKDHVGLLRGGLPADAPAGHPPVWADVGAGEGAFTLALADLLGPGAQITAIDRDSGALDRLARSMAARFPQTHLNTQLVDFRQPLKLPLLDGIVIANALHFIADAEKDAVLQRLHACLRPSGRLIVVEYNSSSGNHWVPYPFTYARWETLALRNGYVQTRQIATVPSRFLGEIYSAVSLAGADVG